MQQDKILDWLALNLIPDIGPAKVLRILQCFPDPGLIFRRNRGDLNQVPGLTVLDIRNIKEFNRQTAEAELRLAEKNGLSVITAVDPEYPPLLKLIPDYPPVLYIRGELLEQDQLAVAVVGTRLCSPYGRIQAERFAAGLAEAHFTVVSGLARGIDTAAHHGALRAGGRTIAVLGSGLLDVYPPENRKLTDRIACSGAVISEFPLRTRPDKHTFPIRNRIISGLSRAILVVEAGLQSGALITSNLALEQNREVFVLPGPVDQETSSGTNNLIKEGGCLVTHPDEIIAALCPTLPFPATPPAEQHPQTGSDGSEPVLSLLSQTRGAGIEEIAGQLNISLSAAGSLLTRLEISGKIRQIPGKRFVLSD